MPTWADFKEFFQVLGWPGIGLVIFFRVIFPEWKAHVTAINAYLKISGDEEIKQGRDIVEIRAAVVSISQHTVPPAVRETWVKRELEQRAALRNEPREQL